jgi:uncharacterized protein (DUF488 family)
LLRDVDVRLLIDVRTVPGSRRNPQFNAETLARSLSDSQIGYDRIAALGGRRGKTPDIPPAVNAFWINESFHNYLEGLRAEVEFERAMTRNSSSIEAVQGSASPSAPS